MNLIGRVKFVILNKESGSIMHFCYCWEEFHGNVIINEYFHLKLLQEQFFYLTVNNFIRKINFTEKIFINMVWRKNLIFFLFSQVAALLPCLWQDLLCFLVWLHWPQTGKLRDMVRHFFLHNSVGVDIRFFGSVIQEV